MFITMKYGFADSCRGKGSLKGSQSSEEAEYQLFDILCHDTRFIQNKMSLFLGITACPTLQHRMRDAHICK